MALSRTPNIGQDTVEAREKGIARMAAFWELTKPGIVSYVLVTTGVSHYVAAGGRVGFLSLLHLLAGTLIATAGSLALNQYAERERDALMRRTRYRPLPSRRLAPKEALFFGALLVLGGVIYLFFTLGWLPAGLTALSAATYNGIYTPLKSRSHLATLAGAVPGALPALIGWGAATGDLTAGAFILFGIAFLWQVPHVLALGWLLRADYARAGLLLVPPSDPEGQGIRRQIVLYSVALLSASILPSFIGLTGTIYLFGAMTLGLLFIIGALVGGRKLTRSVARRIFPRIAGLPPAPLGAPHAGHGEGVRRSRLLAQLRHPSIGNLRDRPQRLDQGRTHHSIDGDGGERFPTHGEASLVVPGDIEPVGAQECPDPADHPRNISIPQDEEASLGEDIHIVPVDADDPGMPVAQQRSGDTHAPPLGSHADLEELGIVAPPPQEGGGRPNPPSPSDVESTDGIDAASADDPGEKPSEDGGSQQLERLLRTACVAGLDSSNPPRGQHASQPPDRLSQTKERTESADLLSPYRGSVQSPREISMEEGPANSLRDFARHQLLRLGRGRTEMRSQNEIGSGSKRAIRPQRLLREYIESGSGNLSPLERLHQGPLMDDAPARGVHEEGRPLHS